jgi:glutamine amidotransferase
MASVAVIDSGVANLESVMGALRRLKADAFITSKADEILKASHVILPGVGAAAAAMARLHDKKLVDLLRNLTRPVMGICLGMQILFDRSGENGCVECLGIIPGNVQRLPSSDSMPVPHMGWNNLNIRQVGHPLIKNVAADSFVYFVHSFAALASPHSVATTDYGVDFSSIVAHKNFYGCQFHPERSSTVGAQILQNFLDI